MKNNEIIIFKTADEKVSGNIVMPDKKFGIDEKDQKLTSKFYNSEK